jgi:hypothetical protein
MVYMILLAIVGLFMTEAPILTIESPVVQAHRPFYYLVALGFRRLVQRSKDWSQEKGITCWYFLSGLGYLLFDTLKMGAQGALWIWYGLMFVIYQFGAWVARIFWTGAEAFCNHSPDFVELCSALQQANDQSYR